MIVDDRKLTQFEFSGESYRPTFNDFRESVRAAGGDAWDGLDVDEELMRDRVGPFGCRCQTMTHKIGDGCDRCHESEVKPYSSTVAIYFATDGKKIDIAQLAGTTIYARNDGDLATGMVGSLEMFINGESAMRKMVRVGSVTDKRASIEDV